MTSPQPLPDRIPNHASVVTQFVLCGIIWGASFLFMKVGLEGLSASQVAWSRLVLGALTLGLFVLIRREALPRGIRIWMHMLVLGVSFCVAPFLLFAWAQQHVTSGLGSIYNATTPIMTAVMAGLLFRVEKLRPVQMLGILVGIFGVLVIIAPWQGLDLTQSLPAQLAMLGATACYGFSLAYMRRFVSRTGMSALVFSFLNIGLGAAVMVVLTPVLVWQPVTLSPAIVGAVLALGCLGTGVAYIWNQNTLRAWGPTRASTVTYITPIVGVALGVVVLGEQVSWNEPVGALVVFAGIVLAQNRLTALTRRKDRMPKHPVPSNPTVSRPAERPAGRA